MEMAKVITHAEIQEIELKNNDALSVRINIHNSSSYLKLIRVTCRILSCYNRSPHLASTNILNHPTSIHYKNAIEFWIHDAQSGFNNFEKRFASLGPVKCTGDDYIVGRRIEKWMEYT